MTQRKYEKEVTEFLGRQPNDTKEYNMVYSKLIKMNTFKEDRKLELKRQRQRHMSHTGPANLSRRPCIYCKQEKYER